MRTIYPNTKHPNFVKRSLNAIAVISVACFVLYIVVDDDCWYRMILYYGWIVLFYIPLMWRAYLLSRVIIDEEADTLVFEGQKKYPLRISNLSTITYKESRRGRFRSLLIHDNGIGFMDIHTSKENADRIAAQLTKANPSIVVKHANYI